MQGSKLGGKSNPPNRHWTLALRSLGSGDKGPRRPVIHFLRRSISLLSKPSNSLAIRALSFYLGF